MRRHRLVSDQDHPIRVRCIPRKFRIWSILSGNALERKSTGSANRKSSHHQSFPVLSAGTNFGVEPCDRRPSNGTLTRGGESFAQPLQGCLAACAKAAVIGTVAGRSCSTNLPAPPLAQGSANRPLLAFHHFHSGQKRRFDTRPVTSGLPQ